MIYDGYDLSRLLSVENIDRPILPDIDVDADDRAADGARIRRVRLKPLTISVDVRLSCPPGALGLREGFDALKRELAKRLLRRRPCPLVLDDRPDCECMAVLTGATDMTKLVWTQTAKLSWYLENPVSRSLRPCEVSCEGGVAECYVDGSYPTAPVIELESEYSNDAVVVDGRPMRAERAPASAGTLVFDCAAHAVTKGGVPVALNTEDDYAEWEPGAHQVSCDRPFTVRWDNLWVG